MKDKQKTDGEEKNIKFKIKQYEEIKREQEH
jgi:hypothetical protein